jgi:hypothetical protein
LPLTFATDREKSRAIVLDTEQTHITGVGTVNLKDQQFELLLTPEPKQPGLFYASFIDQDRWLFQTSPLLARQTRRSRSRRARRCAGRASFALPAADRKRAAQGRSVRPDSRHHSRSREIRAE